MSTVLMIRALLLAGLLVLPGSTSGAQDAAKVDFTRDVLPLLKAHCFSCHGAKKQKASLRLDNRELALRGSESGKVIVPGNSRGSRLIRLVTSPDEDERMPSKGKPLTPAEITTLKRWIDQGAVWPESASVRIKDSTKHWAFQTPVRPTPPRVRNEKWVRSPTDRFVLARMEAEGLAPSAEADRATLLRRLSLDLTGLPPSIEEIDAYLADEDTDRVIERLLGSPHYGERWGRHWLDAARYADSDGFEKDKQRTVWFYRDWVINAFNRDLPYDRFVIEQIAGDLLPGAGQDQVVATGFLRNSMINEEGGVHPEQFRMEAMFDRMDAIGKSILGITVQCSQCHDHKFDPFSQRDYYRIFAFLNNSHEGSVPVYTAAEQMKRAGIFRKIAEIEERLKERTPDWPERMAAWEEGLRKDQPEWIVVRPSVDANSQGGQKYLPQEDGSYLCQGYAPTKHTVKMTVRTDLNPITAFRLELLTDPNLPKGGPGRSIYGTGALTEFKVEAGPAASGKMNRVKIASATADVNPPEAPLAPIFHDKSKKKRVTGPVAYAIDGKDTTAWGIDIGPGRRNQRRKAVFVPAAPIANGGGTVLTIHLSQRHGGWNSDDNQSNNLGRIRLSITSAPGAAADPLPRRVRKLLEIPREKRTPGQGSAVFRTWRSTVQEWKKENLKIEELWKSHPEGSAQLALNERKTARMTSILKRGDFLKPLNEVKPGTPEWLHPFPEGAPPDRLGFARWLVDRRSPTTARAIVNRVWQAYFGRGLVETSEDLGSQSPAPSHPKLLDWLAVEFMERGWSFKKLHRLIVNSATYRQSSAVTPEALQRDPQNRFLARGPRLRLEGEAVRDVALAASGLLNAKVGGPSIYPPLPGFLLLPPASYGPKVWHESKGPDRYRRGLYIFKYRSLPYPMLQAFDAPNGDFSCVRRARSNTPLQALVTLNETTFVECARALGLRLLREGGKTDAARIATGFRLCVARRPSKEEENILLKFLAAQRARFRKDMKSASALAAVPEGEPAAEPAAWTAVARVLLNLDETITKE